VELSTDGVRCRSLSLDLGDHAYDPADAYLAFLRFSEFMSTLPANHHPFVFIEEPVVGQGGPHATVVQAFINSAYQIVTQQLSLPCLLVNNQAWKARVAGNGHASKGDIAQAAARDWVVTYPGLAAIPGISDGTARQDLLDAAGVAIHGLRCLQQRIRLVIPSSVQRRW
jgi:Holliday junction resolvasome RuvABC endonuclease subunit